MSFRIPAYRSLARFAQNERGGALVEFGMVLPILFIFLVVVIDGGRMAWIYQSAAYGVRDAARMIARIAPPDLCPGGSVAGYDELATTIVTESLTGQSVIPAFTSVIDVVPSMRCVSGGFNNGPAAIVEVSAQIRIEYIWGGVFGLVGAPLDTLETEVRDQSRVYGL